ncbi:polysaccharide deacetylase family protein [Methanomicrobium mobile]|uniref:polysaccharide deacetylase family protein n=1 Tax=Methanomicrobium mobile TaxID=2205 RepID=UPI0005B25CD0|nr:polysaccharide deacetylase family protein [Methanomicrobium mobile]
MKTDYLSKLTPELWDIATSKEEYHFKYPDNFGRFPHYESSNRDVFVPKVSAMLTKEEENIPIYPSGKSFAVCLTHDIDVLFVSLRANGLTCMRSACNLKILETLKNIRSLADKKRPYFNLTDILDIEEKFDAKSSFYFLALAPNEMSYNYDLNEISELLFEIDERGCEVGLHGGHNAWNTYDNLISEKERLENVLGKKVAGYRNHCLKFKVPDTWEILAKAGFKYDTTFGYADCVGFRSGMCFPYYPYNLNTKNYVNILEIPLIVMDVTLFNSYMRLTPKCALKLIKELIDTVADLHGVFTLLWHNSSIIKGTMECEMYEKILSYCLEKNAWMTSGIEICEWFKKNDL